MKILLAIDGSVCSDMAINEVLSRPWPTDSEIRIVSAFQVPISPTPEAWGISSENFEQMERVARQQAETIVDRAAAQAGPGLPPSIGVTTRILIGSPAVAILEESEDWNADLIVVGSHGYGALQRFLLGSVSQTIVSQAKCSVEVVRCAHAEKTNRTVKAA
jgi:nucleotide-binding universal stress UspA family protein